MTKVKATLSIDEEIFKKAKKHLPNISEFVEECLKQYLGLVNGTYPTSDMKDIIDAIGMLQAKAFILNEDYDLKENQKIIEEGKINKPFLALWNDYKRRLIINDDLFQEVLEVVPVDSETLENILDFAEANQNELSLNPSWVEVYELYKQEVN